jgi:glyoxylase-like metal-dependent hydrolase (beta-lactamase superfamily II)
MRVALLVVGILAASCAAAKPDAAAYHLISGSVPLDKGPDGNSIILDAPDGLIVVDTGRHPEHSAKIIAFERERGRPIAAIVNTHWHLDHTTGNWDLRQAYPEVEVYATTAIEGALAGFLNRNRAEGDRLLADPNAPPQRKAQLLRARSVVDNPDRLRATRPVLRSDRMTIAGRELDVHVAPFAATEADIWLYDPKERLAIVGDLVVDIVPFMDTACPDGWLRALDAIERTPFTTLIPGHGPVMNRADFGQWKKGFADFVACGRSDTDKAQCVAGWETDAARFIDEAHRGYVRQAATYYIDTRLRSSPEEQQRYCKPLKQGT